MSSKTLSAAVVGLDAELVEVEADSGGGELGEVSIVGLPDAAISESRQRVRSAIKNSGFDFPKLHTTINLAPANLKKHGAGLDLPIAISILALSGGLPEINWAEMLFVGELALDGAVRPVSGILPIAIAARREKIRFVFVPAANAAEAKLTPELEIIPVSSLAEVVGHLRGQNNIAPAPYQDFFFSNLNIENDMAHVRGQEHVKRALEIAAAGAHNILLFGPPGSGKTLLAKTFPSILPDLTLEEALEITKIYSVAGKLKNSRGLITARPFRAPHHTASNVALVGGGTRPMPGEISLAHRGVLFLDEFAEFPRPVLEALRQPLEDGVISVSRAAGNLEFPAKFTLIASMNPCPCGYFGDRERPCTCSANQILSYRKKISGPILDRIDIHLEVPRLDFQKLAEEKPGESSISIKKRVQKARDIQKDRFKNERIIANSEMPSERTKTACQLSNEAKRLAASAVDRLHLSARAYFRVLKLARTIADLDGSSDISSSHLAEALQYREKNA